MSPENTNVILIEDNVTLRGLLKGIVERSGHKVVAQAGTLAEALDAAKRTKELQITVAVVDGNLTEGDFSGYDGEMIAKALKTEDQRIKIVSCSGQPQTYGDVNISKRNFKEVTGLGQTITDL